MQKRLITLLVICAGVHLQAQPPPAVPPAAFPQATLNPQDPFRNEITEFKHRDSIQHPPANAILFVGNISFRKWANIQFDFPGYTIINRGIGGFTLEDAIHYAKEIIYPYHPKQIVIYCGDIDLINGNKVTGKKVYKRFVRLYDMIRKHLGNVDILYVSMKPSPVREKLMPEMEQANDLIRNFMAERSHAAFVDIYHLMLDARGRPIDSLFVSDKLHMNEKGYKLWQQTIQPYLDK